MLTVFTTDKWDKNFFDTFVAFRNEVHKDIITSFPETLEDYSKYFHPTSVFTADFGWQAFKVMDGSKILAQAILCWRHDGSVANLGFIDWLNHKAAAKCLADAIIAFARSKKITSIKTPVDMNFFIKYRIRLPGGESPFYGEPVYPDYYHDLFKLTRFKTIGEWDTYRVNRLTATKDFFAKRKKLSKKNDGGHSLSSDPKLKTTIRGIRMSEWDKELKIIYDLFSEAYKIMPEYEPITYPQFKIIYEDFKYIIQPWLSYIVELQGKPVAFSINFVDPLPILAKVKGKKLNALQKAIVFAKLRANLGTFMIAHVGKIQGPNGEDIKGVQAQVSRKIAFYSVFMRKVIVSFQNVDSPSRRAWNAEVRKPYAQYVLYGMDL
ncbi:MAG TPA: hypothetical protein VNJ08_06715 [Bacteriovoracaceae bacterium]|nr:hypothetical protein [Bacteriovoracaceae bacterium]